MLLIIICVAMLGFSLFSTAVSLLPFAHPDLTQSPVSSLLLLICVTALIYLGFRLNEELREPRMVIGNRAMVSGLTFIMSAQLHAVYQAFTGGMSWIMGGVAAMLFLLLAFLIAAYFVADFEQTAGQK
ncbi:hypothetical protein CMK12_16185 [Candidatus Poribacteria bacterium]|nr:hypothetical protein [Candidatus Poribacteria bacterium]